MKVIALDPGEHTAFVIATIQPTVGALREYHSRPENTTAFRGASLTVNRIGQWYGIAQMIVAQDEGVFDGMDVFVIEDYRIYPNRANKHIGSQVYTAKEIGRIEWIAFTRGCTEDRRTVVFQAASMAKQRWPQNRLRDHLGNYVPPERATAVLGRKQAHIADAFRHLFTFFERNGGNVL